MHNVFKGIVVGVLGFIVWFLSSVFEAFVSSAGERTLPGTVLMYLGFLLMVGGPIVYIVVIPIINRLRRRRK